MYKMRSGTDKDSPKALLIGPGAIYIGFEDVDNLGRLLGATKGGNTFRVDQEIHSADVDGALGPIKGMQWVTKIVPELETNLLDMRKDNLALALANMQLKDSGSDYVKLTQDGSLVSDSYFTIAIVGEISGSEKPVIVVIRDALPMDPVEIPLGTGKDDVVLKIKWVGHYEADDQYGVPYEIYYPKSLVDPGDIPVFTVSNPVISPAGGTFDGAKSVQITCDTAGSTIYYTLDGSDPKESGTAVAYAGPLTIDATSTLKAAAKAQGVFSGVVTVEFTIKTAAPTISPNGGSFEEAQTVTLACAAEGADIYYTLDGSVPTEGATLYTGPFELADTTTVKAIAVKAPAEPSNVTSATFTINLPYAADPVIDPPGGSFDGGAYVTITSATSSATIYYTNDGSDPKTSSTKKTYGGRLLITDSVNLKACAVKGSAESNVVDAEFTVSNPLTAPKFSPNAGAFENSVSVTLSTTTEGAEILYTLDGSDPKTNTEALTYEEPINITQNTTIKAFTNYNSLRSAVVEQEYSIF